jgi:phage terminase small subunit
MSELNAREKQFTVEFVACNVGKESAIKAGYSAKTAEVKASQLLRKVKIREVVASLKEKQEKRTLVDADYVITGLKKVAERCMQAKPKMIFDKELKEYQQEIDEETGEPLFEFDSAGANRSLELLGKHLDIFKGDNPLKDLLTGLTVNVHKNYGKDE